MAVSRIDEAGLNVTQYGNRNLVINGAMEVSQRGTSFTADGYSIDRFYHQLSGGTSTLTQETFSLGSELEGFTKYLKMVVATGNDYCGILHKVEDVKSLPQGKATLSFYAKGTNPSTGSLEVKIFRMHDGSTVYDTLLNTTVTLTSSWQRFTNTFDVGSLSGMSTPNANSLLYIAIRQSGSDTGTAAWELNLTGVQLEVGDTATPFEHRTYGDELQRCQRYCFVTPIGQTYSWTALSGYCNSTSNALTFYQYPVRMRATPTLSTSGNFQVADALSTYDITSQSIADATDYTARVDVSASGLTAGRVAAVRNKNDATAKITFDAEL